MPSTRFVSTGATPFITVQAIPELAVVAAVYERAAERVQKTKDILEQIIDDVVSPSLEENFVVGGRPGWAPRTETTQAFMEYYGDQTEEVLVRSGTLQAVAGQKNIWSIKKDEAALDRLPMRAWYGVTHQYGFTTSIASATAAQDVPERVWALMQPEDVDKAAEMLADWAVEQFE